MIIKINGKKHPLPDSWADVAHKKRAELYELFLRYEVKEAKMIGLNAMLGIPKAMFLNMNTEDIAVMLRHINWFSPAPSAEPIQSYFELQGTRYYFPKADFQQGTSIEFMAMQELYNEFIAASYPLSMDIARRIGALIVREMDKKTKKRVVLLENDEKTIEREKVFKNLTSVQTMMVLNYVEGVLTLVESVGTKLEVFDDIEKTESEKETPSVNLFGWRSVFRSVAQEGPFGTYEDVLQRPFWDIIEILAERAALKKTLNSKTDDIAGN